MDAIFHHYDNPTGPGCAVSVIKNNEVVFKKGYGMANLQYDIPISPATIFDIASVSKQFTGFAISSLIEQGKITEDDDIRKYLPEVPNFGKTIRIRHLLYHISGIRDWPQTLNIAGWRWDEVFSFGDIMRMVKYQKDLDFESGSQYSYSNTGYNLLAMIVEKVSGETFPAWVDENIFKRLGMNSTQALSDYTKIIRNLACSYAVKDNGFANIPGSLTAYGSSSIFTSLDDLNKWVVHFQKMVSSKNPVFLRMLTEGVLNNGEKVHYGYGLGHGEEFGLKTISHTGGWAGYRTIITNYPDQNISIIILSNADDFDVSNYEQKVAGYFLKGQIRNSETKTENLKDLPTVNVDTLLLNKYAGTYQLGPGWIVTLTVEKGQLMTQANGEDKFSTAAKSDSVFWIDAYGASMTFVKEKNGEVNLLKYKSIQARRITPFVANPLLYHKYAGTYYSNELETEYTVSVKENKLFMHHMRLGDFELSPDPSAQDQFTGQTGTVKFFTDDHKNITGFNISGGRIKNIRFDKRS
ncbi:MAG TPA: serine hydrolase domain-containing protein [Puia sp.]|nr:serine hydrolase domain-containing protein [Puia sp.]